MADSSNAVANSAIQLYGGNQPPVAGNSPTFDNSPTGIALQKLYPYAVATVARQWGWDFGRNNVALTLTGNAGQLGYAYEYAYPAGVEVWQLTPKTLADPNNPLPQNWDVGNSQVAGTQTKVIWSSLQNAYAVFNNNPVESTWDPLFREAVVRLLASELAMAIPARPDSAQQLIESGAAFESLGETRPD